jgi:hypothetical protein
MKNHLKSYDLNPLLRQGLLAGICLWLLCVSTAQAQLELVPLGPYPTLNAQTPTSSARTQALTLPFFDDFSTVNTSPDPRLWVGGSGVYINNTLTTNHPSVNIATFDGLNAQGVPYNFTNEQSQGESDTLASLPIDLGGLSAADSVYLSFYWQAKGLGELPDLNDTLRLEFLDRNNQWVTVWKRAGAEFDSLFQQSFVPVREAAYLHAGFQFRFRAFGRQSGAFDTWHIDYVYLNKNRSLTDRFIKDVAVRKPLTSLLQHYSAMPFRQYFADPAANTADSVRTDIVNLFNNFNFTSFTFTVVDRTTNRELQRYQEPVSVLIAAQQTQNKSVGIQPLAKPANAQQLRVRYKFDLLTTDDQNPTIPTVNLRRNDTLSAYTDLTDYYAYDDGSAEFGVRMNQRLGRTVVQFVNTVPDTLGGIRMALVPFRRDVSGQAFTVQVWSNRNGRPDQVLYQKSVPVRYGATRSEFTEYVFDEGVAVTDTFYVGWLQISEDALAVGFDRNSPLGGQRLFTNLSQEWTLNNGLSGSVMIRPFFGGKASGVITPVEPVPTLNVAVYPNPTPGVIQWDNHSIKQIDIFSLQGINVRTLYPTAGQTEASLADLPEGMYILRISDGTRTKTQKIVLKK